VFNFCRTTFLLIGESVLLLC